jgi:hypothetical protein
MIMVAKFLEREKQVQEQLLAIIGHDRTEHDMNLLRLETGMDYLRHKYPKATAKKIWNSKTFWAWWRIVWHMNNMDVLDFLSIEPDQTLSWDDYAEGQFAKSIYKWNLSKAELKEIGVQNPPSEAPPFPTVINTI